MNTNKAGYSELEIESHDEDEQESQVSQRYYTERVLGSAKHMENNGSEGAGYEKSVLDEDDNATDFSNLDEINGGWNSEDERVFGSSSYYSDSFSSVDYYGFREIPRTPCNSGNFIMDPLNNTITKKIIMNPDDMDNGFPREALISTKLGSHPFIVNVLNVECKSNICKMSMEYCNKGDMRKLLNDSKNKSWSLENKLKLLSMIAVGIEHIHSNNICHRDLKPENIFIKSSGFPCIGDFGSAIELTKGQSVSEWVGTTMYMAPEIINSEPHDMKCDSWSFGCIAYETIGLRHPFRSIDKGIMSKRIREGKYTKLDIPEMPELQYAIEDLLKVDKNERATINDFIECECVQNSIHSLTVSGLCDPNEVSSLRSVLRRGGSS